MTTATKTIVNVANEVRQAMIERNGPEAYKVYYSTEMNTVFVVIEDRNLAATKWSLPVDDSEWAINGWNVVCLHTPDLSHYPNARSCYPMFPGIRTNNG
ncbi:hypothetical protein [Citricoccus nitrophenolicus]|uniref:hypothetical protein n=1 Tax=Citricoccus nitrophenolicus TaxID=863575 RepID=UPI0031E84575